MKNIEVVAAIITFNNKFLCIQRDLNKYEYISKKYEFPGGKIEINESKNFDFQTITLGESRLRTETAGIVACHLLNIVNTND